MYAGEQGDNTYWDEDTRSYLLLHPEEDMVDMPDIAGEDAHTTGFTPKIHEVQSDGIIPAV